MGFVQGEDVMNLMEDVMAETLAAVGVEHAFPLERMQYRESMDRFGNDRPDTRFGMELVDITDIVKNTGFKVFSSVAQSGGVVKAINAKGAGDWSRGDVEKLADIAAENGAKGMAWIAFTTDGKEKSPIIKFFSDEEFAALKEAMDRLSDREKHILRLRFFEGKTQMEVSARIGISQAQISRLEKNAIQKIKREL